MAEHDGAQQQNPADGDVQDPNPLSSKATASTYIENITVVLDYIKLGRDGRQISRQAAENLLIRPLF